MNSKQIMLLGVCIVLAGLGGKTMWELINFNQIPELQDVSTSISFKVGFVVGKFVKVFALFVGVKLIYNQFFSKTAVAVRK